MKILAIKLRAIGDTVIWTSALSALRAAHPGAEIHVLTYAANAAVLRHFPGVDAIHLLHSKSGWELVRQLWRLRTLKLDWLLGFHATTGLCRWAWLAGARHWALHHHSWTRTPRGSVTLPRPGQLEDAIARDYQLLQAMGIESSFGPTHIALSAEERQWADSQLRQAIERAGGDVNKPRFLYLPGAGHHLRRYPKDLWLARLHQTPPSFQPVVVVDEPLAQEWNLQEECLKMRIPVLAGTGGLREFLALVGGGQRALANDSGPGHISVALGIPTEFVFGPGCVGDWHPYDRKRHPIHRVPGLDCRLQGPRDREEFQYCTVTECSHHKCMRDIRFNS